LDKKLQSLLDGKFGGDKVRRESKQRTLSLPVERKGEGNIADK